MNSNYNKSKIQTEFERLFEQKFGIAYNKIKETDLKNTLLNSNIIDAIKNVREDDIKNLYFNGLLSVVEAIKGITNGNYSWPTVKLYYACFYLLKCSLICKDIVLLKQGRNVFYIQLTANETFTKVPSDEKSDHQSTIWLYNKFYDGSDILLTNDINGKNPHEWMRKKREEVNYQHDKFQEPNPPYFWQEIDTQIKAKNISKQVSKFLNDEDFLYTFQEEYAILAVPIKRLDLTYDLLKTYNIESILTGKQQIFLKRTINELKLTKELRKYTV